MIKGILSILVFFFSLTLTAEDLERSPRFLVHILDYIAVDYSGAISNGKIIHQGEYDEQIEFSNTVIKLASELPELKDSKEIQSQLQKLRTEILQKSDPNVVSQLARTTAAKAIQLSGISNYPRRWPNLTKGKQLYSQNCAQCHGAGGHGDGPAGGNLDPTPADFFADKMNDLPPFQLYNAIRLGVPGTAMASFTNFSDSEVWDLSFYVLSLKHGNTGSYVVSEGLSKTASLAEVATKSDRQMLETLSGTEEEKKAQLSALRVSSSDDSLEIATLGVAEESLKKTLDFYQNQRFDSARTEAIVAYLNGIEPVEPRMRAKDYAFTMQLEKHFADVRAAIERRAPSEDVEASVKLALDSVAKARNLLETDAGSPLFTFLLAAGIFLREGFEAALILITLLGIVRAVSSPQAALYIHAGWITAMVFGVFAWFFSGWILQMSGAQREMLEGVVAGLAVVVLLYFGFWLHRKTEIGRWRVFIEEMTEKAVSKKNMMALGTVAFMGVFRECFETVLFLRALLIEAGPAQNLAVGLGVFGSFILVLLLSFVLIRQSARVPVRKLFQLSSVVLVLLALILVGKMMHAFQEVGVVGITPLGINLRSDLLGFFPTVETLVPQVVVLSGVLLFALLGNLLVNKANRQAQTER